MRSTHNPCRSNLCPTRKHEQGHVCSQATQERLIFDKAVVIARQTPIKRGQLVDSICLLPYKLHSPYLQSLADPYILQHPRCVASYKMIPIRSHCLRTPITGRSTTDLAGQIQICRREQRSHLATSEMLHFVDNVMMTARQIGPQGCPTMVMAGKVNMSSMFVLNHERLHLATTAVLR